MDFQTLLSSDFYVSNLWEYINMNNSWMKSSCIIIPQYHLSEKFDTSAWKTNVNMQK